MFSNSKIEQKKSIERIVVFTDMSSIDSPSVFVNVKQLVPWFYSKGIELALLEPFPFKLFNWLSKQIGFKRVMWYIILPFQRFFQILFKTKNADIVIVHKSIVSLSYFPVLEKLLRRRHKHIVFNFDDAVYEKGIPYVPDRISLADAVWVGNQILSDYSKKFCNQVIVIESAVDCKHYTSKSSYEIHEPLILIWSGTAFSHQYLEQLREPLKILSKKRNFIFKIISGSKFSFNQSEIVDEWIPFDINTEIQHLREADIAVMPLADGLYEKAKENYKVKLYMACGLPLVCSPVGLNIQFVKDGERGFLAKSTTEWVSAIEKLANSKLLRENVGSLSRQYILANYDIPIVGDKLLNFFYSVIKKR